MNSKLALTAIVMVAVTLGLGVLSPAMAAPPAHSSANKESVCHYEAEEIDPLTGAVLEDDFWTIISISSNGNAVTAHLANHVNGTDFDMVVDETDPAQVQACEDLGFFQETVDEDED